jgi:hypothetical protein
MQPPEIKNRVFFIIFFYTFGISLVRVALLSRFGSVWPLAEWPSGYSSQKHSIHTLKEPKQGMLPATSENIMTGDTKNAQRHRRRRMPPMCKYLKYFYFTFILRDYSIESHKTQWYLSYMLLQEYNWNWSEYFLGGRPYSSCLALHRKLNK